MDTINLNPNEQPKNTPSFDIPVAPTTVPSPTPQPTTTNLKLPTPSPAPQPTTTNLKLPTPSPAPQPTTTNQHPTSTFHLNLLILAGVILITAGSIGYLFFGGYFGGNKEDNAPETETVAETAVTEPEEEIVVTEEDSPIIERNEQRVIDLTDIEKALKDFFEEYHLYPEAADMEKDLVEKGYMTEIPKDPTDWGEFKYAYAVYDNEVGANQEYILSGVFENEEDNSTTIWTTPESTNSQNHTDYRDDSQDNVIFLTNPNSTVTEETDTKPKVKVKRPVSH